ncbi:hypothetical protein Amn_01100 [Aminobacter sp. Y103A]|nr:hypothetical protein Amn_01100 [Aminobacter sp. SS-2016]
MQPFRSRTVIIAGYLNLPGRKSLQWCAEGAMEEDNFGRGIAFGAVVSGAVWVVVIVVVFAIF